MYVTFSARCSCLSHAKSRERLAHAWHRKRRGCENTHAGPLMHRSSSKKDKRHERIKCVSILSPIIVHPIRQMALQPAASLLRSRSGGCGVAKPRHRLSLMNFARHHTRWLALQVCLSVAVRSPAAPGPPVFSLSECWLFISAEALVEPRISLY